MKAEGSCSPTSLCFIVSYCLYMENKCEARYESPLENDSHSSRINNSQLLLCLRLAEVGKRSFCRETPGRFVFTYSFYAASCSTYIVLICFFHGYSYD